MSARAAVLRGREAAEALMIDVCRVHRPGPAVTDPVTAKVTAPLVLIYEGKCKIQQTLAQSSNPEAGGHQFTVQDTRWDTPVSVGRFMVGDVVTVDYCELDPQLVGRVFRVKELFHKSMATAQRTRAEEVIA